MLANIQNKEKINFNFLKSHGGIQCSSFQINYMVRNLERGISSVEYLSALDAVRFDGLVKNASNAEFSTWEIAWLKNSSVGRFVPKTLLVRVLVRILG